MKIYSQTSQGIRSDNQDAVISIQYSNCFLLAVADGMGGYNGGNIASEKIISVCEKVFYKFAENPNAKKLRAIISLMMKKSQEMISLWKEKNPKYSQSGSTLTLVLGFKVFYVVANIGDSRTYIYRNETIHQITSDHSYINEHLKNKDVDEDTIKEHSHILTRCIDGGTAQADIYPENTSHYYLHQGEVLILCSDGLILDYFNHATTYLTNIIHQSKNHIECADRMIQYAINNGSSDNISICLASYENWPYKKNTLKVSKSINMTLLKSTIFILTFLIIVIVSIGIVNIKKTEPVQKHIKYVNSVDSTKTILENEIIKKDSINIFSKDLLVIYDESMNSYFISQNDSICDSIQNKKFVVINKNYLKKLERDDSLGIYIIPDKFFNNKPNMKK